MTLKFVKAFTTAHSNGNHFAVVLDANAGLKDRYTVFQWGADTTATVIGRELPFADCERLINKLEEPHGESSRQPG